MAKFAAELRCLPHSADAEWVVIDTTSDHGDVWVQIDPYAILSDLGHSPEALARIIAAAFNNAGV
jgi:hypothetical protein